MTSRPERAKNFKLSSQGKRRNPGIVFSKTFISGVSVEVAMQLGTSGSGKKGVWHRPVGTRGKAMADAKRKLPLNDWMRSL